MELIEVRTKDIIPEIPCKVLKRKPAYQKSEAVRELEFLADAEAILKHPSNPCLCRRSFRDDTANALTKCICEYIRLTGGFVTRINNQGTFNYKTGHYIPTTARKGLPDIQALMNGKYFAIEIKAKRDRQSDQQKQIEREIISSGGYYFLCRNFEDFKTWYDLKTNSMDNLLNNDQIRLAFRYLRDNERTLSLNQIELVKGLNKYFQKMGYLTTKQESILKDIVKYMPGNNSFFV